MKEETVHEGDQTPAELRALGVIFEEPADRPKRSDIIGALHPVLVGLAAHPGKWARVKSWEGQSGAYNARQVLVKANREGHLPGSFEFMVRRERYDASGKAQGGSILYAMAKESESLRA